MKKVFAIEDNCVACGRCEVACKTNHSQSKNTVIAYKVENPVPMARIRVDGTLAVSVSVNCRHCEYPACVEGCISGAMQKDPVTGIVSSDAQKCVGCYTCVAMCPFGAVFVANNGSKQVAFKCDLCGGEAQQAIPACVAACPNNALIYQESERG